ncbi:MAG TPA: efflux RND transporter periplasmic adaptor subunit [Lentisphaeria bacterium]|nr:efflux RND transporter periplasmic adaptor subunit [Lentisphaeria bacterium]
MKSMKTALTHFLALSIAIALTALLPGCGKSDSSNSGKHVAIEVKKQKYHCPMHPTYVTERPGDCPICNMKLVPFEADMQKDGHAEHSGKAAAPGRVSIMLSPEKRQMIGMQLSAVEKRDLSFVLRTTARVEHDETRLASISPRFNGWIRSLKVNFTGEPVEKGQPLCTVYSPELLTAEKEYLLALQNYEKFKSSPDKEQVLSAQRLWESSRRRLVLWQIDEKEIRDLEETRTPADETLLRAPFSGHVIAKTAVEGRAFTAGETLYEIADLSHLWLRASVFEYEMPLISVGEDATISFPYLGNKSFPSKVTFIYPHIDSLTRRGEFRLELDNPGHLLRPDMWANIDLKVVLGKKLTVPSSAVIDSGTRHVAFVDAADGHLEPRELKIGAKTDDYYEVLEGVKEGEKVVTRALFLVDSESQLKAAISGMGEAGGKKH